MKINVTLPIDRTDTGEEFWNFEAVSRLRIPAKADS